MEGLHSHWVLNAKAFCSDCWSAHIAAGSNGFPHRMVVQFLHGTFCHLPLSGMAEVCFIQWAIWVLLSQHHGSFVSLLGPGLLTLAAVGCYGQFDDFEIEQFTSESLHIGKIIARVKCKRHLKKNKEGIGVHHLQFQANA